MKSKLFFFVFLLNFINFLIVEEACSADHDALVEKENVPVKHSLDNFVNYMWSSIFGTSSSPDSKDLDKKATAVYVCYPGIPLNPSALDGMCDYTNPKGNLLPLEYFSSNIFDTIPDISKYIWSPTLSKVSTAYQSIINGAHTTSKDFSSVDRKTYETARKILYVEKPSLFPDKPPSEVKSPSYLEYEQKRKAYESAISNYNLAKLEYDLSEPDGQIKWIMRSNSLKNVIDNAWSDWISSNKNDIEQALDIMGSTNGIAIEILRCRQIFHEAENPSLLPVKSPPWRAVWMAPAQWWKGDSANWTHLDMQSKLCCNHGKYTNSYDASGGFSEGLFSIDCRSGYAKNHQQEGDISYNLSISMDFCTVLLERDWLITDWMKSEAWYLEGSREGKISSGTVGNNTNDNIMPIIPTAMIVGKNITLTANWSDSTRDFLKQSINSNANIGYGPFRISGHYEKGDGSTTQTSEFDGKTLKVDGMQIIGFVGAVPTKSPSISDPNI